MKKILITIALFFMMSVSAFAGVNLAWDPCTEPDLAGYIVYFQDTTDNEIYHCNAGNVTEFLLIYTVPGHTYDIYVKSYNSTGLSGESNHISWIEPPIFTPPEDHIPAAGTVPPDVTGLHSL